MQGSHERYITVAKRPVPFNSYLDSLSQPDDIEVFELDENEFLSAYDSGFLGRLNDHFHLMLDDFEDGEISEDFGFVLTEARKIKGECPTFFRAANLAAECAISINFEL